MRRAVSILVLLLSVAFSGCRRTPASPGGIDLAVPGRANAHVTLASDGERLAAAWTATAASSTDVYAAVSVDGGRTFAAPVRVNDRDADSGANGEQPPQVLLKGTSLTVVWVSKRGGVPGIRAAVSADSGRTFSPARSITSEGLTGARGWESAAIGEADTVHAVWLDGRNAARPVAASTASAGQHPHAAMRQDLYHAMWTGAGAPLETPVAANVCFCCKTAIVSRGSDVFVAWRHLFAGGVRDIALARSSDGGRTFEPPVRVSEDNWKIDACPDDGPAMTVDPEGALHVAWPTLVAGDGAKRMAIFEAVSRDGGRSFAPRARLDDGPGNPAHPKLATGTAATAVVWDELADGARRIRFRRSGGGPAVVVSDGRIASYPAIAAVGDGFAVAWTQQDREPSVIRLARLR